MQAQLHAQPRPQPYNFLMTIPPVRAPCTRCANIYSCAIPKRVSNLSLSLSIMIPPVMKSRKGKFSWVSGELTDVDAIDPLWRILDYIIPFILRSASLIYYV